MKKTLNFLMGNVTLSIMVIAGLQILFVPSTALAQDKGKKEKAQIATMHSTLPEANIKAGINTILLQVDPLQVNLNLLNPAGKLVNVYIRNYSGKKMFQETFREKEYTRTFNFEQTPSDTYFFHVMGQQYAEKRPFKIVLTKHRTVVSGELKSQGTSDLMAAIYESEPFRIRVHLVNKSEKPILYFIRNGNNEIIFQGKSKDPHFSKTFQLEDLNPGKYTFEIKTREEKISRTFDLQTSEKRSFVWVNKRGQPLMPASTAYQSGQITR
ncbi:hypothetical protein BH24BAC1_BH24BAC1_36640 [soil metagenome]